MRRPAISGLASILLLPVLLIGAAAGVFDGATPGVSFGQPAAYIDTVLRWAVIYDAKRRHSNRSLPRRSVARPNGRLTLAATIHPGLDLQNDNDRPGERSRSLISGVAGAGFEPATFGL